jgi:hypothetical protein
VMVYDDASEQAGYARPDTLTGKIRSSSRRHAVAHR